MSLENPNNLHEFNPAWPTGDVDQIHEGDDHLRNIKRAIQNTFPFMAGRAWRVIGRSESGDLITTDNMTVQNAGGVTLSPQAASVLGNGWMCLVRATSGAVTINPANNINGVGQIEIPAGYTSFIFCDGSEFFALLVYQDVPPSVKAFPTGTRMVFNQTTAPTGWTKDSSAAYNDAAFRCTNGTVGVGGSDVFTTHFGVGKASSGKSLTSAQNGPHTHTASITNAQLGAGTDGVPGYVSGGANPSGALGVQINSSGDGATHDHVLPNFNIKYVDLIVASIN